MANDEFRIPLYYVNCVFSDFANKIAYVCLDRKSFFIEWSSDGFNWSIT